MADEKSEIENVTDEEAKKDEMSEKLKMLETKVNDTGVLAKLMADPDVRALLEAKQRGEKIKLVQENAFEQETTSKQENDFTDVVDYDSMTNSDLVKHITNKVLKSFDSSLGKKLEPLNQVIKQLSSYVDNNEAKTVNQQIEQAKKKYSDFDTYLPEMRELNKVNPELAVEELYLISKMRKVGPAALSVSTEKPTSTSAKVVEKKRSTPLPKGKAGFDQLLSEALDKIELPEIG